MYYHLWFHRITLFATILAFFVITLGAYVRLSDAGLGCPDWPGCYGKMLVHQVKAQHAEQYPERPLETEKAWKEMVHRYFAGTLGLLIFVLFVLAIKHRQQANQPVKLPSFLLLLVVFQALLGMWTVTLLLKPVIVMGHLLGGFLTFSLLFLLLLHAKPRNIPAMKQPLGLRIWLGFALVLVFAQIALGGWTSANYAALVCYDIPTCQGKWWPNMDFNEAFILWRGLGIDYEGGILETPARTAIHFTHRLGAIAVAVIVGSLLIRLLFNKVLLVRLSAIIVALLLLIQIILGVSNVAFSLPLEIAVAHNGIASLLLLSLVWLNYLFYRMQNQAPINNKLSSADSKSSNKEMTNLLYGRL